MLDARSSRCAVQKFITGLMGGHRPFLRETPVEKLFRFRGVIAVISVPVMLIVLVAGLMPRASTDLHDLHDPHQEAEYDTLTVPLSAPPCGGRNGPGCQEVAGVLRSEQGFGRHIEWNN